MLNYVYRKVRTASQIRTLQQPQPAYCLGTVDALLCLPPVTRAIAAYYPRTSSDTLVQPVKRT